MKNNKSVFRGTLSIVKPSWMLTFKEGVMTEGSKRTYFVFSIVNRKLSDRKYLRVSFFKYISYEENHNMGFHCVSGSLCAGTDLRMGTTK